MSRGRGSAPRLATYPVDHLSARRASPLGGYDSYTNTVLCGSTTPTTKLHGSPEHTSQRTFARAYDAAIAAQPQDASTHAAAAMASLGGWVSPLEVDAPDAHRTRALRAREVLRCHSPFEDRFPNRYHARRGETSLWHPSHVRCLVDFP